MRSPARGFLSCLSLRCFFACNKGASCFCVNFDCLPDESVEVKFIRQLWYKVML